MHYKFNLKCPNVSQTKWRLTASSVSQEQQQVTTEDVLQVSQNHLMLAEIQSVDIVKQPRKT